MVMIKKLGAKKLRESVPKEEALASVKRNPIILVLDEILDTYNIGSMFRLADAVAAESVYLCGQMEYPPSARIHKAAVGTENWVPWIKKETTLEAIDELKKRGVMTIAVEQDKRSVPYWDLSPKFPVALVLGHETKGVRHEVLNKVDKIVELPMEGINISFNVWGSAAVVSYKLLGDLLTESFIKS